MNLCCPAGGCAAGLAGAGNIQILGAGHAGKAAVQPIVRQETRLRKNGVGCSGIDLVLPCRRLRSRPWRSSA